MTSISVDPSSDPKAEALAVEEAVSNFKTCSYSFQAVSAVFTIFSAALVYRAIEPGPLDGVSLGLGILHGIAAIDFFKFGSNFNKVAVKIKRLGAEYLYSSREGIMSELTQGTISFRLIHRLHSS
jgi:hypothetical protein